jgi:DNA-binding IscR family transcriptional regulator
MNSQFTVSLQMLLVIMLLGDQKATSAKLAESAGVNPIMIRQLFGKLKEAGILNVCAGKGVTRLAKDPSLISLWDVYSAVEGLNAYELFKFCPNISDCCQVGQYFQAVASVHLDESVQAMAGKLASVSLAQLMDELQAAKDKANKDS